MSAAELRPPGERLAGWVMIPALLAIALLVLPLLALLPRVAWSQLPTVLGSPDVQYAIGLSLRTAALAVVLCLLLGIPLALLVARARPRTAALLRVLVTLPLVLPPLVGGVALLAVVGRNGLLGPVLEAAGLTIAFTPWAIVLAQTFVAMPFLVIALEGSLRAADSRYGLVAATLGAGRWHALRRVTLPLVAPSLLGGTVLAFARAIGEFGATAMVAGNRPGVTQTVPMAIYTAFNGAGVTRDAAIALSVLLVLVALAVLLLMPAVRRRDVW